MSTDWITTICTITLKLCLTIEETRTRILTPDAECRLRGEIARLTIEVNKALQHIVCETLGDDTNRLLNEARKVVFA